MPKRSPFSAATHGLLMSFCNAAAPRRVRGLREWAESVVRIPEGPHRGERFRCRTLPWTGLLFDAIDSGEFRRVVVTGNVQGGKTLAGFALPTAWHLAEHRETVVTGVPVVKTGYDKVRTELRPIFMGSPELAPLWPAKGKGSQGGEAYVLQFGGGAELRIMGGGGGDEERSSYTTRVVTVTEADRLDDRKEASTEASPIYQLQQRAGAFGARGLFYAECTVTSDDGFVWREYQEGTASRILCPCVHCGVWVAPERDHFAGAETADTLDEAIAGGRFHCPDCGEAYDDRQRREMNEQALLVHRGQTIEAGEVVGKRVSSRTLGFRFSAFHNLLWTTEDIATKVWEAAHDRDEESSSRAIKQWCWVEPAEPEDIELAPITREDVLGRAGGWHSSGASGLLRRGLAPADATVATAAVDLRQSQIHYTIGAFDEAGRGHVCDAGSLAVDYRRWGVIKGLRLALVELHKSLILPGLPTAAGELLDIGWTPIDHRYRPEAGRTFIRWAAAEHGDERFLAAYGCGVAAGPGQQAWRAKAKETDRVVRVSEHYYLEKMPRHRVLAIYADTNRWKTAVREGLTTPAAEPGALTVFDPVTEADEKLLHDYSRQVVAERPVLKRVPDRGVRLVWEQVGRRANHLLDCTYWMLAAAHLMGVRVLDLEPPPPAESGKLLAEIPGLDGERYTVQKRAE